MYKNATYHNLVAQGGAFSFTGTIGSFNLTDDDIMEGGLQIDEALTANSSITVGGIVTSQLKLTLNNFEGKFSGFTFDESVTITGSLNIDTESVTLPTYHIIDYNVGPNVIEVIALDYTDLLNAQLPAALTGSTYKAAVTNIATAFGMTATFSTTANTRLNVAASNLALIDPAKETYKSALLYILQKCNVYARIQSGTELYLYYIEPTATPVPIDEGMIVKLDIDGPHTPTLAAVRAYTSDSLIASGTPGYNITLEGNPLVTTADPATLLSQLSGISFYNFSLESIGDPSVQIGDYITIGGAQQALVASKSYKQGGYMTTALQWSFDNKAEFTYAQNGEQGQAITNEITGAIDEIAIGGRNLIRNTLEPSVASRDVRPNINGDTASGFAYGNSDNTVYTAEHGIGNIISAAGRPFIRLGLASPLSTMAMHGLTPGKEYTLSFDWAAKILSGSPIATSNYYLRVWVAFTPDGETLIDQFQSLHRYASDEPADRGSLLTGRCEYTFTIPEDAIGWYIQYACNSTSVSVCAAGDYLEMRNIKLEEGNKATAWSPAPEDVVTEGGKTATEYITYIDSTDGIHVHSSDDLTDYVQINSDAVSMYRDNVEVTRIEDSKITLGKTSDTHTKITSGGFDIVQNSGSSEEVIAHFGYAEGASTSGTAEAPFTSLGKRKASEVVGNYSVAEGYDTIASAYSSHAEGNNTAATAQTSHAEGDHAIASRNAAHAEGYYTTADGQASHAEGDGTTAAGDYSHAEGRGTSASVTASHAEGYSTSAEGFYSHAEGYNTTASGLSSHSEGSGTQAEGYYSHAQNAGTIARGAYQTAIGKYNVQRGTPTGTPSGSSHSLIIGNGADDSNRSNALAVDFGGNAMLAGDVYIGCNADSTGGTRLGFPKVGESITLTNIYAAGFVKGSQKQLHFFLPYAFAGAGTYEITDLSIITRFINGVYGYLRSGTDGATYTAMGTGFLDIISNGEAVRSNEIAAFTVEAKEFSGFRIQLNTEYAVARANTATTAVTNNTPVTAQITATVKRTA